MPDAWGRFTDTAELAGTFTHVASNRCGSYAPLYARLGAGIADDPCRDPTEPRLRLIICDAGQITQDSQLGHYQPHGAWLEGLTTDVSADA